MNAGIPDMPDALQAVRSMFRNVPLPIEVIIDGQYIEIAMPVKNAAMSGLMPLLETVE
jgi:hypothetical protein